MSEVLLEESTVTVEKQSTVDATPSSCTQSQEQVVVVPTLALHVIDHHFASGVETLNASYTTQHLGADNIRIRITGTNYGGNVVYEADHQPANDGQHAIQWRGDVNQGALNGLFVTPLYSPYTITVSAETAQLTQQATVHVLYRSIALGIGTWTEDGNPPDETNDRQRWVQFQLNTLGYIAGPVDGNIGDDTTISGRAMMRYAHEHPNLQVEAPWFRDNQFWNDATFRNALRAGDHARTLLPNNTLPGPGETARILLDHNFFYYNLGDFDRDDGNVLNDRNFMDPFELPLEATITLMSQNDADGTGLGVASPRGVGEVKVQWLVTERPENTSRIPKPTTDRPTKAKKYVDAALLATWDQAQVRDNCPAALGGTRAGAGATNRGYFYIGTQLAPYTSTRNNDDVFSTAYQGATAGKRGKAGILFKGSHIAGDNYELMVRITFDGLANQNALEQAHTAVFGNNVTFDRILYDQTGTLEVVRRYRVGAVIDWPAPPRNIDWNAVAGEFAQAFCELDATTVTAVTGTNFVNNQLSTVPLPMIVQPYFGETLTFAGTALFPYTIPAQGSTNASAYKRRVTADMGTKITTNMMQVFAEAVAQVMNTTRTPGSIIIQGKWVPTITVRDTSWFFPGPDEQWDPRFCCIGLARGVVILNNAMYNDYHDRFIVAHEMSHSRFLRHHETGNDPQPDNVGHVNDVSDNPGDHDLNDHNCTMSYPSGVVTRPNLSWATNAQTRPGFCGKCLLKLRGWNVSDAVLPRQSPP